MGTKQLMLVAIGCILLLMTTASAAAEHQKHLLKVGEKGEITLKAPTKIGDRELQPGVYVVQHRTSGGDHFVRFVELKHVENWEPGTQYTYTEADKAGELKCRVESAGAPSKTTTVYLVHEKGLDRITKVAVKGEDVVHIF